MIYISLDRSTRLWRVVNFIEDHNHPLVTQSKRRYLPVNRVITPLSRALFQSLNTSNISPSDQYCVAAQEAGGFDHMQYTPSDLSNMRRDDRCNIIQRDADLLIELFEEKKNKSSDFFFSFTRHDNGHLSNLFWADPGCRQDYDLFGDSITFDTTYKTNKYNLVLALFCGVNHHKNTIIFAVGFLSRENVESFEWIFNEFLNCMTKHPKTIITDQDPAMKNALLHVFPNTFHRFCLWHITHKMGDKIGHTYQDRSAMAKFHDFLNNSTSITFFEESWLAWVSDNGLIDNIWLRDIYRIRFQWCPIYMIDHFFAGMKTTQRSERMNSIVKMKIRSHYTLLEFHSKCEYVLLSLREKENSKDHHGQYAPQKTLTSLAIERQMCELYTHKVLIDFQDQALRSMHYFIRPRHMENQIFDAVSIGSFKVSGTIHIGDEGVYAKCTCRLFESFGIPCRHIICYLTLNTISILPETLVCNRWRAIQRKRPTTSCHTTDLKDTGNLRPLFNHLISLAGDSEAKISTQGKY